MHIREAIPGDATMIREIALSAVKDSDEARTKVIERAYRLEEISRAIFSSEEASEQLFLVGEVADGVVGFFHAIDRGDTWEVLRLYLDPNYQRRGFGAELIRFMESKKRQPIDVYVESSNNEALSFLMKQGFEEMDRFEEEAFDEVLELIHFSKNR